MLDLKSKVPQVYIIPNPGVNYAKISLNAGVRIQHHNTGLCVGAMCPGIHSWKGGALPSVGTEKGGNNYFVRRYYL